MAFPLRLCLLAVIAVLFISAATARTVLLKNRSQKFRGQLLKPRVPVYHFNEDQYFVMSSVQALAQVKASAISLNDQEMVSAQLSHFVYQDDAKLSNSRYKLVKTFASGSTKFVVVTDDMSKRVYVAFRGTIPSSIPAWLNNMNAFYTDCPWVSCGSIHTGFLNEYKVAANELIDTLRKYVIANYQVIVTGHSKGAAHATIAAVHLNRIFKIRSMLVTFGSPRVGDEAFVSSVYGSVSRGLRFVTSSMLGTDLVTNVPPEFSYFRHAYNAEFIDGNSYNSVSAHSISKYVESLGNMWRSQRLTSFPDVWNYSAYSLADLYDEDEFIGGVVVCFNDHCTRIGPGIDG